MIFVGFLWRKAMLTEKVVHMCMGELLTDPGPEELECAARLMTTVGSYLEVRSLPLVLVQRLRTGGSCSGGGLGTWR